MISEKENGEEVDYHRSGTRFNAEHDILIHHKGTKYQSKMQNISITGVIASASELTPDTIHVGDICGLSFCADPTVSPMVYSSRVTRIDTSGIALQFLGFIL